jgi:hypothetical protein
MRGMLTHHHVPWRYLWYSRADRIKWKEEEVRGGGAQPLFLQRGISNLAASANSACREPLVIMEEEASIHRETGAFDRLPPNVIER